MKEDKRRKVTRYMLETSFLDLVSKKDFSKITVSELTDHAGLNRGTFYLYYTDINDLQDSLITTFIEELKTTLMPLFVIKKEKLATKDFISEILNVLYNKKELTKALLGKNLSKNFLTQILEIARQIVMRSYEKFFEDVRTSDFNIYFSFVSGGAISVINEWVVSDFRLPLEHIAEKLHILINASLEMFADEK